MSTVTFPIEEEHLARLREYAEARGTTVEQLTAEKMREFSQGVTPQQERNEIEGRFRAELAALPRSAWEEIDPEIEAVTGLTTKEVPEDYWQIVLEVYK